MSIIDHIRELYLKGEIDDNTEINLEECFTEDQRYYKYTLNEKLPLH